VICGLIFDEIIIPLCQRSINQNQSMKYLFGLGNNRCKIVVAGIMVLLIGAGCKFYFKTTEDKFTSTKSNDSFERGKNLAFNICAGCHYDHKVNKFIGKPLHDLPRIAGRLVSANLTNSATNGIPPKYGDADLFYLFKTGIGRSGRFLPYMMRPMMADEDINDIIVYLRSNDPAVTAADTTVGKTYINLVGKFGIRLGAHPQPYSKGVQRPNENDPVIYGRYLVAIIGCYHCHSSKVMGLNYADPEKSKGYLAGGIKLKTPEGKRILGPNLTPDKETGIGNFTKEDFRNAVREGITPSGRKLSPPMGQWKSLTDKQVDAIYTYLQSLQPKSHKIRRLT
jgi:mono/diheme cytochrome c family protein